MLNSATLPRRAGHDVQIVLSQELLGSSDQHLFEVCATEERCLVTFDLDFADVTRFPPSESGGIVIIRLPHNPSLTLLERLVGQFLEALTRMPFKKDLWIVEADRIRIHQQELE